MVSSRRYRFNWPFPSSYCSHLYYTIRSFYVSCNQGKKIYTAFALLCPNSSRYLWILKMSVLFLALGIVLFMFRSVYLYSEFSSYKAPLLQPSLAAGMLKLLPEEHIKTLFTHDGIWWDSQLFPLGLTSPSLLLWLSVLLCPPYSQFPTFLHLCWLWMWFQTTGPEKISVCRAQTLFPTTPSKVPLWFWRARLTQTTGKTLPFCPFGLLFRWVGLRCHCELSSLKKFGEGFPGGLVVKNPLANAGDKGLISDSRKIPHTAEQLSLCHNYWASALEPVSHN